MKLAGGNRCVNTYSLLALGEKTLQDGRQKQPSLQSIKSILMIDLTENDLLCGSS